MVKAMLYHQEKIQLIQNDLKVKQHQMDKLVTRFPEEQESISTIVEEIGMEIHADSRGSMSKIQALFLGKA
jgi:hypothetical protein